jgi:hypothetical protein
MQTAGVPGWCLRLYPSNPTFQFFDPSDELKRAWEGICQSVRELTRVVEVNKEFWGLTVRCGAVGMHTLAGTHAISTQQTGFMAHDLMDRSIAGDYAMPVADDSAAMDPVLVTRANPDSSTTGTEE